MRQLLGHFIYQMNHKRRWCQKVCTSSGTSRKGLSIDLETVYRSFFSGIKMYTFLNSQKGNILVKRDGYFAYAEATEEKKQETVEGLADKLDNLFLKVGD